MTESQVVIWFGRLSAQQKAIVLVDVMHELTIVVRSVFHDFASKTDTTAPLAYKISELNHRLTSAAFALLIDKPTYPDRALIEMLWNWSETPELMPYFPFVLEQAMTRAEARLLQS